MNVLSQHSWFPLLIIPAQAEPTGDGGLGVLKLLARKQREKSQTPVCEPLSGDQLADLLQPVLLNALEKN